MKDEDQIYMFMELVQGGELWVYIYDRFDLLPRTKFGGFQKEHAQFYAGCVVSAFDYIHSKGVAYRDLKVKWKSKNAKSNAMCVCVCVSALADTCNSLTNRRSSHTHAHTARELAHGLPRIPQGD
jgi:serine/threonine protein kinase